MTRPDGVAVDGHALRGTAAAGWRHAAIRGLVAVAVMGALGQAMALLSSLAQPEGLGLPTVAALGGLFFYSFHHVAIRMEVSGVPFSIEGPVPGSAEVSITFAGALLLATAVAGWLLFRAGRAVADAHGGPPWARALHGAKPAVPYAAVAFAFSFADRLTPPPSVGSEVAAGGVVVRPVALSALLWPLALGAVFGVAGGLGTRSDMAPGRWGRRLSGSLAGGWRMTWAVVALAMGGLFVLAAVQPQDTARYFELVARGPPSRGVLVVVVTALLLPNAGVAVAAAAMGGSVTLELLGSSCSVLSYGGFPGGVSEPPAAPLEGGLCGFLPVEFGAAPAGYFLFLLVPVVATVWGGWRGAERSGATTPRQGAVVGAAAGVVFAVLFAAVAVLDRVTSATEGPSAAFLAGSSAVGPALGPAFGLALAWGALGGAAGGLVRGLRTPGGPATGQVPGGALVRLSW